MFFQAEDGIRYLVRSRGLGDVYKRQGECDAGRLLSCGHRAERTQAVSNLLRRRGRGRRGMSLIHI